ncbi:MAG: hypothetical protein QOG94_2310 [Solirubrobacteraceae bacterium]|nr:hypothetical protein [Solirubrobacteraceae bacterium]
MRYATTLALLLVGLAAVPIAAGQGPAAEKQTASNITDGSAQLRLDRARKAWKAAGPRSYSFEITVTCFCPNLKTTKVVVRDGRPVAGTPDFLLQQATVPRLFRTIQRTIDAKAARLDVIYGERGVPSSIVIDGDTRIADDEVSYTIEFFKPRK